MSKEPGPNPGLGKSLGVGLGAGFLGAVALAVPIGVVTKSYSPLAYAGLGGTALDLLNGYNSCTGQREALRVALEAAEASRS